MARGNGNGNGSYGYSNPFNEVGNTDPNSPDVTGQGLYYDGWDEINKMHLSATGPLFETANSKSGRGTMGGPAPGEPQAANPKTGD
jgi:hypothetical protein